MGGGFSNYLGLGVLSIVLVTTVLFVPLIQVILHLRRWFMPLDAKGRKRWFVIMEALEAWKYVEVYILSIIIASWQLGEVSEYMINDYCDSFETAFAAFAYYGVISGEDAQCFRVDAQVETSTWILLCAALLLSTLSHFVGKAASQQEEDEYNKKLFDSICEHNLEQSDMTDTQQIKIKAKGPRFSDYYGCLIRHPNEVSKDENDATICIPMIGSIDC